MENNIENLFDGFDSIGYAISSVLDKTASERAAESLSSQAYIAGLEDGLGIDNDNMAQVTFNQLGREAMRDFIPGMFLSH